MSDDPFPLFDAWPRLRDALPRVRLGAWPTPVQAAPRLARWLGVENVWIKREDCCDAFGGNKVRGLELLLGEAERRGARTVLTIGAAGSYHVRSTAVFAAQRGLKLSALLVRQPRAAYVRRNLTVAFRCGARLVPVCIPILPVILAREYLRAWRRDGARPALIPAGGSGPRASIAHVNAALELRDQIVAGFLPEPDWLFVPMGSLGTAAGLALGCRLAGLRTRVAGVVVFARWYCTAGRTVRLARRTNRLLSAFDPSVEIMRLAKRDVTVVGNALGAGYAHFTREGIEAARALYEAEGLLADGTYTAKMYAGVRSFLRCAGETGRHVLIWHTFAAGTAVEPLSEAEQAQLPRGLRSYFDSPPQPLDAAMPKGQEKSRDRPIAHVAD